MSLFQPSFVQVFDNNGDPLNGAKWKFYLTGTTTPTNVFSDPSLITSLGSVVTSDSAGRFNEIFINDAVTYRAILTTSADVVVLDIDPFNSKSATIVNTIAELKALSTTAFTVVTLTEAYRAGTFVWRTGNYTAFVAADTLNGIYVPANTDTGGAAGCWVRMYTGFAYPEWWGAQGNNGAFDSYPALQACLNVAGRMFLTATYYGTRGLVAPAYSAIKGSGALTCGYRVAHATDHLLRQDGVASVSYLGGGDFSDFALARTPTPTTPGSVVNDVTQGHGLHFFMVSNPRVKSVYTYNNLVECYVGNCLSADIKDVRGIRETGGGADRWYGLYIDGVTAGGTFGGPSPNPSTTITKPNMIVPSTIGTTYNYYFTGALQDLWVVDPEAAGAGVANTQIAVYPNSGTCGDIHIIRPICDGYGGYGIHCLNVPPGSSLNIVDAWIAPRASATSSGVRLESCNSVTFTGRGNFNQNSGLIGIQATDCHDLSIDWRVFNCQSAFYMSQTYASDVKVRCSKDYNGAAFGQAVRGVSGGNNRMSVNAVAYGTQKWIDALAVDNTATNYVLNAAGIDAAAATNKLTINAVAVTTQGNVSGHVVIMPGAGAML